jgi:hypothetical protein
LDYKDRFHTANGLVHDISYDLCDPYNFTPPYQANYNGRWHQGIIPKAWYLNSEGIPSDSASGHCLCWDPCIGCGATDSIVVYELPIREFIFSLQQFEHLPSGHYDDYVEEYINRDWVHELGHALGLHDDSTSGDRNNVMVQGRNITGYPNDPDNWWSTFHFYGGNLHFPAGATPKLRN